MTDPEMSNTNAKWCSGKGPQLLWEVPLFMGFSTLGLALFSDHAPAKFGSLARLTALLAPSHQSYPYRFTANPDLSRPLEGFFKGKNQWHAVGAKYALQ
eukprot:4932046-Amphidinium_carterae.2